jgi:hypothetical protein
LLAAKFPDNFLGNTIAIHVSRVDEATASFVIQIELVTGLVDIGITTPGHSS